MPSIQEAVTQLALFASSYPEIKPVMTALQAVESLNPVKQETDIRLLRAELHRLLAFYPQFGDNPSWDSNFGYDAGHEAIYQALIALAEFKFINTVDPITQDELAEIPVEDRIVVSTGYWFSLPHLIYYHNTRDYRGSALQEQHDSRWLINPLTNQKFPPEDQWQILIAAAKKEITISYLKIDEIALYMSIILQRTYQSPAEFRRNASILPNDLYYKILVTKLEGSQYTVLNNICCYHPQRVPLAVSILPPHKRLDALHESGAFYDNYLPGETLQNAIMLIPPQHFARCMALPSNNALTTLRRLVSPSTKNFFIECLHRIKRWDEDERIALLSCQDKDGMTLLHDVAHTPDLFAEVLDCYPSDQRRLEALEKREQFGYSPLHWSARNDNSLLIAISLYPKEMQPRLEAALMAGGERAFCKSPIQFLLESHRHPELALLGPLLSHPSILKYVLKCGTKPEILVDLSSENLQFILQPEIVDLVEHNVLTLNDVLPLTALQKDILSLGSVQALLRARKLTFEQVCFLIETQPDSLRDVGVCQLILRSPLSSMQHIQALGDMRIRNLYTSERISLEKSHALSRIIALVDANKVSLEIAITYTTEQLLGLIPAIPFIITNQITGIDEALSMSSAEIRLLDNPDFKIAIIRAMNKAIDTCQNGWRSHDKADKVRDLRDLHDSYQRNGDPRQVVDFVMKAAESRKTCFNHAKFGYTASVKAFYNALGAEQINNMHGLFPHYYGYNCNLGLFRDQISTKRDEINNLNVRFP